MSVRDLIILGCSSQQPTRKRNQGGYLFRWNDEGLLFDPGEGTQRQFIFANIAPTVVTRIFVSHFHGDHCLGLPSMLMRLNLDRVNHPIHVYYPASGKKYFDRLHFGTIYHERITIIEHPVAAPGIVHDDGKFVIEATFLEHGIDNIGWRITEPATRKFDAEKLHSLGVMGMAVKALQTEGELIIKGTSVKLDDVSYIRPGDSIAVVLDTRLCQNAIDIAKGAKLLLCESTYLDAERELAQDHYHMTAKQAAYIAKEAGVHKLILTHFSARYLDSRAFEIEARETFANSYAADDLAVFALER